MDSERAKMSEMEKKILRMEERENQLLDRLKNSQAVEAEQFSRLEDAIQNATSAYSRRKEEWSHIEKPRNTSHQNISRQSSQTHSEFRSAGIKK